MPITANGRSTLAGMVNEPETGCWEARIEVDDEDGLAFAAGRVTVTTGLVSWVGTVKQGSVESGRYIAEIVGGNASLTTVLDAKYYYQSTLAAVVADILSESGELLDPASSQHLTGLVAHWVRVKGEASLALQAVANEIGGFWRMTRAGLVSMQTADGYVPIKDVPTEESRDPSRATIVLAPDEHPYARPGVAVGADKIVTALTQWDGVQLRQTVHYHDGTENAQDTPTMIAELARRANLNALIYSRWYPCKVIAQEADGSLQLYPDDAIVRGNGLTKIPLRLGLPGCKVVVAPGARVELFFENADPKKPACALSEQSSTAAFSFVLGELLTTWLATHTHPTSMGPSGPPLQAPTLQTVLSVTHKLES